jgi:hypothetical protein
MHRTLDHFSKHRVRLINQVSGTGAYLIVTSIYILLISLASLFSSIIYFTEFTNSSIHFDLQKHFNLIKLSDSEIDCVRLGAHNF